MDGSSWFNCDRSVPSGCSKDTTEVHKHPTEENKREFDVSLARIQAIIGGAGTIATIVGGVFLFLNFKVADKNARIAEDKQITERFSRAIEHLGNKEQQPVRLGGIYSLERIAKNSPEDCWTIVEVLSSFIREYADHEIESEEIVRFLIPIKLPTDIQATFTVLDRIYQERTENKRIDLREIDFSNKRLNNINLSGANLKFANLSGADLSSANLGKTILNSANLSRANFSGANLSIANLSESSLSEAIFSKANLSGIDLNEADLSKANLSGTNLSGTNLSGTNLSGVSLSRADLSSADIRMADLTNANLRNANFSSANLTEANLSNADCSGVDLSTTHVKMANFIGCTGISELSKQDLIQRGAIFDDIDIF